MAAEEAVAVVEEASGEDLVDVVVVHREAAEISDQIFERRTVLLLYY